jgi:Fe-S-cluster containining protein
VPFRDCSCKDCVRACSTSPGWFKPGQAEAAAAHLRLPFAEFRDAYLVQVQRAGVTMYAPARVNDKGGCPVVPDDYESPARHAACAFLVDERCAIHAVKPYECRVGYVCGPGGGAGTKAEIIEAWR